MKRTKCINSFIQIANARIAAANIAEKQGQNEPWKLIYNFSKNYLDLLEIKYDTAYAYWDEKEGKHIECNSIEHEENNGYIIFK